MTGRIRLSEILKVFGWIGLTSLGGGRGVYFHAGLVDKRRRLTNHEFRERPWALACARALALLAAVVLHCRWLPSIALVLAAGFVGWLAGL